KLVSMIALGYARGKQPADKKRGMKQLLRWEHY
ncbi:unnamed protein product, partial [marine sediment metagenome]